MSLSHIKKKYRLHYKSLYQYQTYKNTKTKRTIIIIVRFIIAFACEAY